MATISKLLQRLPFLALFLMLADQPVHSQDVTAFAFDTFLIYQGGAHIPRDSAFLRLTETDSSDQPVHGSVGRVLYSRPVVLWEKSPARQATFEATINFIITPSKNGAADGLAFFIAPVNSPITDGGGNLGIFSSDGTTSSLFAVEFDNYVNEWDPDYRHIGIDIQSRTSRNTTRFDSATGELVTARINYNANTKTISVVATSGSQTASLSYVFDLKTILPEQVQVGISSATGKTAALHDVISWYFTSSLVYTNANYDEKTHIRKYMGM